MSLISPELREQPSLPRPRPRRHEPARLHFRTRAGRRPWSSVRRVFRLPSGDREVLWLYLLTRAGLWITAYCARWLFPADPGNRTTSSVFAPFQQWDWYHYLNIARDGYFPDGKGPWLSEWDNREAFFPGFPLLLRAVHVIVPHWTAAGLLISFVAGGIAVVALARITRLHLPSAKDPGRRAVLFFLLSPCAVFLAAGYTEALFLALALPAWLAAQQRNLPLAATLAGLATAVRISGLFLAAAIAVHLLLSARRHWRALPWLALPALPAALYAWYLHAYTGDWLAWKHAQERGWYRDFYAPWDAWSHTWTGAFGRTQTTGYALMFQAELLALLATLLLLALLLKQRRWPEATYVGLALCALGTSYWYMSIPRATLLSWPLWVSLAAWSLRRPRIKTAYLCLAAPVSTVFALTFLTGRWAG
ncbi:mannosyltransferase family protein [Streptomyces kronopolitis]|uniref:mannosyltransferase family protein n=1 Tax=Streptomyces kronopolitis TaxID=1612435 RepID=UPI0036A3002B